MRRALARVFDATKTENCIPISGKDRLLMTQIAFFDDIVRLAREYHVDGVIDANLKFCTLYNTEKSAGGEGTRSRRHSVFGSRDRLYRQRRRTVAHAHRGVRGNAWLKFDYCAAWLAASCFGAGLPGAAWANRNAHEEAFRISSPRHERVEMLGIGVDIGSTATKVAVLDGAGEIVEMWMRPTGFSSVDAANGVAGTP